jgi:hypothetical protein
MAKKEVYIGGQPGQVEDHGTVVGRRGAGLNTKTGGDPILHSFNHYGKSGVPDSPGVPPSTGMPPIMGGIRSYRGF